MCGRTSLFVSVADLEDFFGATVEYDFGPRYNIAPGQDLDVVPNDDPWNFHRQ